MRPDIGELIERMTELEKDAAHLRNRIQEIRIDHPEAADRLRIELRKVEALLRSLQGEKT